MVPSEVFPPETSLTDQVTAVFELPVTVAEKDKELAARIFTDAGDTVTVTAAGVVGAEGAEGVEPVLVGPDVVPAQPIPPMNIAHTSKTLKYLRI
jgi:hypothetical protein